MEIAAAAAALIRTIVEPGRGIVLGWVVLRTEILRRRFVRIGLALVLKLLHVFGDARLNVFGRGVNLFDVRTNFVIFRVGVLACGRRRFLRASERFARENEGLAALGRSRSVVAAVAVFTVAVTLIVVTVIVTFEILKNVADVEESIAVQADVHESRLHARQNACDSSFVDAADEGEFLFALDVDFD